MSETNPDGTPEKSHDRLGKIAFSTIDPRISGNDKRPRNGVAFDPIKLNGVLVY